MPVGQAASAYVYEGVWINWSRGRVLGATLTLSPKNALILISLLAIFAQLSGTQLWRIIQFILHQVRATDEPMNGLYHQQQVILRNSSSELGALWQMLRVAFAWRTQNTVRSYQKSSPLIALALLHLSLFTLAGIFSSRIIDAGDQVLSRSPLCGTYSRPYLDSLDETNAIVMPKHRDVEFYAYTQARYQQSQQYVQFCSDSESVSACRELPRESIPWSWTVEARCPFQQQVCFQDLSQSVVVDTGLISSHRHLGLNAPEADRIQYRKVTTCTILNDAKYISDWKDVPATTNSPAKRVVDAYYGLNKVADRNSTYSYSAWDPYYSFDQYSDTSPYKIDVKYAPASNTTVGDFVPIPELARADADIFLAFLSFSKVYEAPVTDPWFTAQKATNYPTHDHIRKVNGTVYAREQPVTTMACAEQHQLCIDSDAPGMSPDPGRCTPLSGYYETYYNMFSLKPTARQLVTMSRVFTPATEAMFYQIIKYLAQRDTPLRASRMIQGLIGLRLPDDQWQKEILYWNSIAMTHLQRSVIDYSTGQFAADTSYINITQSPSSRWVCQNQMIGGTKYQSFNFFVMMIVLVFGTLIVVAGYTIEDCVALWRKRQMTHKSDEEHERSKARRDMWVVNDMFEMLRMVHSREGHTVWSHSANQVPITGAGQMLTIKGLPMCSDRHLDVLDGSVPNQQSRPVAQEDLRRLTSSSSITLPDVGKEYDETKATDADDTASLHPGFHPTLPSENRSWPTWRV